MTCKTQSIQITHARHQHTVFMSALNEDAPVSDGNNRAYVMDLREMFIHVSARDRRA